MPDLISLHNFRIFDLVIWAVVALCLIPSVVRSFSRKGRYCDDHRAALFFVALWICGNYAVRIYSETHPISIGILYPLNALAAVLAVYVLILVSQGSVKSHDRRDQ